MENGATGGSHNGNIYEEITVGTSPVEEGGSPSDEGEGTQADADSGLWDRFIKRITRHKPDGGRHRYILPYHLLHHDEMSDMERKYEKYADIQRHYCKNDIRTTKYTVLSFLPKNLFEQFHRFANCYFVFIVLLNFIPAIGAIQPILSMVPVICILVVQAIKDIAEDYGRYRSDALVNNSRSEVYRRADDKYHSVKWKNVQVGDIVRLFCNKVIPADILLLHTSDEHGVCYIETSNIDGETNLKQRMICKGVGKDFKAKDFKSIIQSEKPNPQIDKFTGNIISVKNGRENKVSVGKENLLLRGCVIRNTDYVEGIVIYAGHETKAMMNNNGPRYKRSKLERRMNLDVIWCVIILIIACIVGAVGNSVWASYQSGQEGTDLFIPPTEDGEALNPTLSGFYMFWTMVILLQILIPISLYVSIEIVKMGQVYFINKDLDMYHEESDKPLECRALNITEDLGQVQYVFSDKTGTLTENSMVFRRCTVGGCDYPHAANAARIEDKKPAPPELNPALEAENQIAKGNDVRPHSAHSSPFLHNKELRSSYRRPASSTRRAHHRRNPSQLSVKVLQKTLADQHGASGLSEDDHPHTSPNSPARMRRAQSARASAHRLPHKHHRRNISAVSAKEIMSSLAQDDQDEELEKELASPEDTADEEEFLEADVTPDPVLYRELESISSRPVELKLPSDKSRILDFFINLAICNTVVLSTDNPSPTVKETDMENSPSQEKFTSLSGDLYPEATNRLSTISSGVGLNDTDGNNSNNSNRDPTENPLSFSPEYLKQIHYEAESPDEAALVYAAHAYGCCLAHRTQDTVTVTLPKSDQTLKFEVLHTLDFDSTRKRMSVVVRDKRTNQIVVYCKGADSTILQLLRKSRDIADDSDSGFGSEQSGSSHLESNDPKVLRDTQKFLDQYARTGLRTLCIAKRVLSEREYKEWEEIHTNAKLSMEDREQKIYDSYIQLEKNLELLGATGIEDRLQDGVPETIESLRKAGMQVWVITGDKQETAVNIGYSCKLIESTDEIIYLNASTKEEFEEMLNQHIKEQNEARGHQPEITPDPDASLLSFAVRYRSASQPTKTTVQSNGNHPPLGIVIDGKTLEFALSKELQKSFVDLARRCHSVLVCRATPLQKGQVVKLVKEELHVMTLAIGDGANDVSMIQVADIGVGISGQEGMQAVMSSDFAMARFRFLQKLLLVHGHWNYQRLAMMVLYFFYKNAAFVFLIFWFQFFCGFSGANPIEQWYLLLFNLVFTSIPPLINGMLDVDVSGRTLLRKPHLYLQGINNEMYTQWSFWINILDAIYQSLALFFIPYFAYYDTDVEIITWGTPMTTACMFANLVHLGIETKTWTWIHWAGQIFSIVIFFVFSLAYNAICVTCLPWGNPYWNMETLIATSNFWFSIILATAIAVMPRYIIRSLQSTLWPTETQRERVLESMGIYKEVSPNITATTSANTSSGNSSTSTYQNDAYMERHVQETGTDAMAYQYNGVTQQDDHLHVEVAPDENSQYVDLMSNKNQNNIKRDKTQGSRHRHQRDVSDDTAHGVNNPAYIEDWSNAGRPDTSNAHASNMVNEPETGEISPILPATVPQDHPSILLDHGAPHHQHPEHVTFAATPQPEEDEVPSFSQQVPGENNNGEKAFNYVSSVPPGTYDSGGMTPVEDNQSLASDQSHPEELSHPGPVMETSSPTKLYVSSPTWVNDREVALLANQLPNMAEGSQSTTPVLDAQMRLDNFDDPIV